MKRLLLAGMAIAGLVASGSGARATPFDFTYTGSLVDFTVPTTDTYQIPAFGAQGGDVIAGGGIVGEGGLGAEIGGNFSLTAGEILQIAVGGAGVSDGGGEFCRRGQHTVDHRWWRWWWWNSSPLGIFSGWRTTRSSAFTGTSRPSVRSA